LKGSEEETENESYEGREKVTDSKEERGSGEMEIRRAGRRNDKGAKRKCGRKTRGKRDRTEKKKEIKREGYKKKSEKKERKRTRNMLARNGMKERRKDKD
jgi:hypothetical protein